MFLAVCWQIALVAVLALVAGIGFDWTSAGYLALGGAVAVIPQGLLAVRLAIRHQHKAGAHPATFFIGEFARVLLTLALMGAVVRLVPTLRWLPFLIGFIVALKAVGLALGSPSLAASFRRAATEFKGSGVVPDRH